MTLNEAKTVVTQFVMDNLGSILDDVQDALVVVRNALDDAILNSPVDLVDAPVSVEGWLARMSGTLDMIAAGRA